MYQLLGRKLTPSELKTGQALKLANMSLEPEKTIFQLGLILRLAAVQAQLGQDQAPANDRHLRQTGECLA